METGTSASCKNCVYTAALFDGLSPEELDYLTGFASNMSFRKGETIFTQGDEIRSVSFLKQGLLKVYKNSLDYKDQIISLAKPNDCVGLLSVFSDTHYQYSISALEDSWIYFVDLTAVHHIIANNGAFGIRMLNKVSKAADTIISNVCDIHKKNLRGRIAFILLEFADNIYNSHQFDVPVSRREMGELIGMTTENVIRILSEFKRDGIITIAGKTITVRNKQFLQTLEKYG